MPVIPSTQLPSGEMPFEKTSPEPSAPPAEDVFQQPSAPPAEESEPSAPPFEESEPSAPPFEESPQGGGAVGRPPWEPYTGGPRLDPQTGAPIPGTSITGPSPIKITGNTFNTISKPQQEKTVELYSLTQQIRDTEFEIYDSGIKLVKEKDTYKTSTSNINEKKRNIESADRIIAYYKEKLKPKASTTSTSNFPTDPNPAAFLDKWRGDAVVGREILAGRGKKDAEWKPKLLQILKSTNPVHTAFITDFNATFPGYDPAAIAVPPTGVDPGLTPDKIAEYNTNITNQEKTKDDAKESIEEETDKQQTALKKITTLKTELEALKVKLEELKKQRDALLKSMEVFGLTKPGMFSSKQTEQPKVTLTADELKLRMSDYTKENTALEKLTSDWRSFLTEEYLPSRNEGTLSAKEQAEFYVRTFLTTYQKHVVLNKRRRLTNENALPIIVKLPEELAEKDKDTTDPSKIKVGTLELKFNDVKAEIDNATKPGSKTPDELSFMRQLNAAIADVKRYVTPGVAPPLTKEEKVREQQNMFTELLNNLTEINLTDSQKKKLFDDEFIKLLGNFQVMVDMEELELSNNYETYYQNFSKVGTLSKSGEQKMIKTILEFYSLVKPKKCMFQKGDVIDHITSPPNKGVIVLSVKNDKSTGNCIELKVKLSNGINDVISSTDFEFYKNATPSSDEAKLNSFKANISGKIDKTILNLQSIKEDEEQNAKHIDALITTVENIKNAFNEGKLPEYAGTLFSILKGAGKTLKPAFIALDLSNPDSKIRKMLDVIGQAILAFGTLLYNLGASGVSIPGIVLVNGILSSIGAIVIGVSSLIELLPSKEKVVEAINAVLDKLKVFGTSVKGLAVKTAVSIQELVTKADILGTLNTLMSYAVFGISDVLKGIATGAKATVDQLKKINITNMDDLSTKIWGYTESMASTLKSGFTETKSIEYGEKTRQAIVNWFKTFKFPSMPDFSWFIKLFPSLSTLKSGFIEGLKIAGWIILGVPAAVGATGYAINWALTKLVDPTTWTTLYNNCPSFIQKGAAFIQTGIRWFMSLTKLIGTFLVSFFLMPVATIAGSPIILGLWVVKYVIGFVRIRGIGTKIKELFSKLWKSKEIEEALVLLPPPVEGDGDGDQEDQEEDEDEEDVPNQELVKILKEIYTEDSMSSRGKTQFPKYNNYIDFIKNIVIFTSNIDIAIPDDFFILKSIPDIKKRRSFTVGLSIDKCPGEIKNKVICGIIASKYNTISSDLKKKPYKTGSIYKDESQSIIFAYKNPICKFFINDAIMIISKNIRGIITSDVVDPVTETTDSSVCGRTNVVPKYEVKYTENGVEKKDKFPESDLRKPEDGEAQTPIGQEEQTPETERLRQLEVDRVAIEEAEAEERLKQAEAAERLKQAEAEKKAVEAAAEAQLKRDAETARSRGRLDGFLSAANTKLQEKKEAEKKAVEAAAVEAERLRKQAVEVEQFWDFQTAENNLIKKVLTKLVTVRNIPTRYPETYYPHDMGKIDKFFEDYSTILGMDKSGSGIVSAISTLSDKFINKLLQFTVNPNSSNDIKIELYNYFINADESIHTSYNKFITIINEYNDTRIKKIDTFIDYLQRSLNTVRNSKGTAKKTLETKLKNYISSWDLENLDTIIKNYDSLFLNQSKEQFEQTLSGLKVQPDNEIAQNIQALRNNTQQQTNKLPKIKETELSDKTELIKSSGGTIYTVVYNGKKYIFKNLKEGTSGPNDAIIKTLIDNPKNIYTNMLTNNTNITSPLFLVENSSNETIGYIMNFLEGYTSLSELLPNITTEIQLKRIISQLLEGLKSIQKSGTIGCPEHGNNIQIKNFSSPQQQLTIIDLDDIVKCDRNTERDTIETLDIILTSATNNDVNGINATNSWLFEKPAGQQDRKVKATIQSYDDLSVLVNTQTPPAGGYRNHQTIRNSHWRRSLPSRRRTYRTY